METLNLERDLTEGYFLQQNLEAKAIAAAMTSCGVLSRQ